MSLSSCELLLLPCLPLLLLLLPCPAQTFSLAGRQWLFGRGASQSQASLGFEASDGFQQRDGPCLPRHTAPAAAAVQPQSAGGDNRGGAGRFGCSRWEAFLEL